MLTTHPSRAIHALAYFFFSSLILQSGYNYPIVEPLLATNDLFLTIAAISGIIALVETSLIALQSALFVAFRLIAYLARNKS